MLEKAKNAQKARHFQQKSFIRYFQKCLGYGSNVIWGSKYIPWTHSGVITIPPTFSTANPLTYSQQLPFLAFLELFLPTAWTRPKISQHLLTKILESLTHTLK